MAYFIFIFNSFTLNRGKRVDFFCRHNFEKRTCLQEWFLPRCRIFSERDVSEFVVFNSPWWGQHYSFNMSTGHSPWTVKNNQARKNIINVITSLQHGAPFFTTLHSPAWAVYGFLDLLLLSYIQFLSSFLFDIMRCFLALEARCAVSTFGMKGSMLCWFRDRVPCMCVFFVLDSPVQAKDTLAEAAQPRSSERNASAEERVHGQVHGRHGMISKEGRGRTRGSGRILVKLKRLVLLLPDRTLRDNGLKLKGHSCVR